MKSPIKELSPRPLIDVWHAGVMSHGRDSVYQRTLSSSAVPEKEISLVRKHRDHSRQHHDFGTDAHWKVGRRWPKVQKNVSFSPAVITIHFPHEDPSGEAAKIIPSVLWYSASDFQRFRAESYEIAAKASGDVDFQHFFLNFVFAKAAATAANHDLPDTSPAVTYAPFARLHANPKTRNFMSISIDSYSDLCMLSKYRGLERIIFRNLVQPSKLSYIEGCIQYHKNIGQTEPFIGHSLKKDNPFCHHTVASQLVSQYLGQIDDIIAQEQVRAELQNEQQLSFLSSQPVHLSFPVLASLQILQRSANDKKATLHRRRCLMEL
jgi:hypothetical protein